jgi:hypothetical protein
MRVAHWGRSGLCRASLGSSADCAKGSSPEEAGGDCGRPGVRVKTGKRSACPRFSPFGSDN